MTIGNRFCHQICLIMKKMKA